MSQDNHLAGPVVITGKENIENVRILRLRSALRIEVNCPGLKMSRGSIMNEVKRTFPKFKGQTKKKILAQLDAYIDENILPAK